jgi:LysM repeat protein
MWLGESQWRHGLRRSVCAGALIASICLGTPGPVEASPQVHKVIKGESLTSVSRKYGVTISRVASANGLKATAGLQIGQTLVIPDGASSASSLPASVQKSIDKASVKTGRWKNIVIHHSGTAEGSAKGMENYHRRVRHMENGLAYHFVIGNGQGMKDGEIFVGNRWTGQIDGGHLHSLAQNKVSLGICLVGNFDKTKPTAAQMKSLKSLLSALETRCKIKDSLVTTHRDINVVGTRCPGRYFPVTTLRKELAKLAP